MVVVAVVYIVVLEVTDFVRVAFVIFYLNAWMWYLRRW